MAYAIESGTSELDDAQPRNLRPREERILHMTISDQLTEALARADGHRWVSATEARRKILRRHYAVSVQAVMEVMKAANGTTPQDVPEAVGAESGTGLDAWLYQRFGRSVGNSTSWSTTEWSDLDNNDRFYWKHEAQATIRAVRRGGFKNATEDSL